MRKSFLLLAMATACAIPAAHAQVLGVGGNGGGAIQAGPVSVGGNAGGRANADVGGGLTETTRTIDSVGSRVQQSATATRARAAQAAREAQAQAAQAAQVAQTEAAVAADASRDAVDADVDVDVKAEASATGEVGAGTRGAGGNQKAAGKKPHRRH